MKIPSDAFSSQDWLASKPSLFNLKTHQIESNTLPRYRSSLFTCSVNDPNHTERSFLLHLYSTTEMVQARDFEIEEVARDYRNTDWERNWERQAGDCSVAVSSLRESLSSVLRRLNGCSSWAFRPWREENSYLSVMNSFFFFFPGIPFISNWSHL